MNADKKNKRCISRVCWFAGKRPEFNLYSDLLLFTFDLDIRPGMSLIMEIVAPQ
jgi:hypothetical protein